MFSSHPRPAFAPARTVTGAFATMAETAIKPTPRVAERSMIVLHGVDACCRDRRAGRHISPIRLRHRVVLSDCTARPLIDDNPRTGPPVSSPFLREGRSRQMTPGSRRQATCSCACRNRNRRGRDRAAAAARAAAGRDDESDSSRLAEDSEDRIAEAAGHRPHRTHPVENHCIPLVRCGGGGRNCLGVKKNQTGHVRLFTPASCLISAFISRPAAGMERGFDAQVRGGAKRPGTELAMGCRLVVSAAGCLARRSGDDSSLRSKRVLSISTRSRLYFTPPSRPPAAAALKRVPCWLV